MAKNNAQFRGEGADHVDGTFATRPRAAHRFTIDGEAAVQGPDDAADPATKDSLELLRIDGAKKTQEGVFRGNPVLEPQEAAQPGFFRPRPESNVFDAVAIGKHGSNGNHQNFPEVMQCPVTGLAWIGKTVQVTHQAASIRRAHFCYPKDESRRDFSSVNKGVV